MFGNADRWRRVLKAQSGTATYAAGDFRQASIRPRKRRLPPKASLSFYVRGIRLGFVTFPQDARVIVASTSNAHVTDNRGEGSPMASKKNSLTSGCALNLVQRGRSRFELPSSIASLT